MEIGLIDVDGHNFPNLALMKISAWHKARGDYVEWHCGLKHYNRVYMSRVFDDTYSSDYEFCINADEVIRGGTGYDLKNKLPDEIEHIYPDYSLYPELTKNTAYGFLTRGCPRACKFCIVAEKEGRCSRKVANLSEFWNGQRNINLLDPNILACKDHIELLRQLADSKACVDFNQGLDIRCINNDNIELLNQIKVKEIHFAWDNPKDDLEKYFMKYRGKAKHKPHGHFGTVYCLTNFDGTHEEDLYRIYTLRDWGFDPYVMIYDKPNAPRKTRLLQRWCNNKIIFRAEPNFEKYNPKMG